MSRFTLLCVDDEKSVLDLLFSIFRGDYNVLCASSGEEALEIIRSKPIDLLVTDQRMPNMTGTDLIERARELAPQVPSILLTAHKRPTEIIDAINRGRVYRYVTKPWDLRDLRQTVRTALEQVVLERTNRQLLRENQRRLDALELLNDVSRGVTSAQSYSEFIETLIVRIGDILAVDVVASLTQVEPSSSPSMTIRCLQPIPDSALEVLQEALTGAFAKRSGTQLPLGHLLTRVTGHTIAGVEAGRLGRLRIFRLETGDEACGVIAIGSVDSDAISAGDERILEVIATQAGDVLGALRNRVQHERERTEAVIDRVDDGLVVLNPRGEVVLANRSALRLLGADVAERLTSQDLHRRLGLEPFEIVRSLERSGAAPIRETVEVDAQTLVVDVYPILDGGGGLESVVYRLRAASEGARRDALLSFVSHELRTPLASVHGTLDLLLDGRLGSLTDEQTRYVRLARDASLNLSAVLHDLVDESAVNAGRIELNLETASLNDLVTQATYRFEAAMRRDNIGLELAVPPTAVRALVDPARIQQVLNNLLTNALKFTSSDGHVGVEVFTDGDIGESCGFTVWNSGESLEDEELDELFQPQHRRASPRGYRGNGLGLSIARSIVEGHGGHIWAERDDLGVRFIVVLPRRGLFERDWTRGFKIDSLREIESNERAPRVLLVESERATAYAHKSQLMSRGYVVDLAHSADEAMQRARDAKPVLVIVDNVLEGLDGLDLMHILRHDPDTQSLPIVALCPSDSRLQVSRAGADSYLPKPVQSNALIAVVQRLISGSRDGKRILIVDDDTEFRAMSAKVLSGLGFLVGEAGDGESALERAVTFRPDLIILDVNLPGRDGFALFRDFKYEPATEHASVIFVSGRTSTDDKIRALRMGGDDYLVKPFEPLELGVRAEMVLRRRETEGASSPTTRLPGGVAIEREISRRIESGCPYCLCYLDLDDLKAFNDYYGYAKADGVIRQTADLLREVIGRLGSRDDFLGHVAGDDFVFITTGDRVDAICQEVIDGFDRLIPLYYTRKDRERGYIEAEDRYGNLRRFGIMGASIAAVVDPGGTYRTHSEVSAVAADLKKRAKAIAGSSYVRNDRYRSERTGS
ncbi:MAG: response regulator [Myxococcota bacterium]